MNDNDLDTLLAAPLADVADNGFSRRVIDTVAMDRKRRVQIHALIELGIVATIFALAPFTPIGQQMESLAATLAGSSAVLSAFAGLAVGWLALRLVSDFETPARG